MHQHSNRESIFFASVRYFFIALASIVGVCIGLTIILVFFAAIKDTSEGDPDITYSYSPEVKPNASGVRKVLSKSAPVILKLHISGIIGTELLNRETVQGQLIESREKALKDGRVKAILLVIDSPGGTVVDADGIYRSIKAYKEKYKVPVFAYVDGLCASGGMYVAAAADKVYASEISLIGSVGVITPPFLNFSQLIDKVGVQALTLYAGKGKDDLNPLRPWKPGEEEPLQTIINYYYEDFVNIVTSNRPNVDREKLVKEYGAHVFPAKIAETYGYIDGSGLSLNDTLKLLAKQISIEDDYYQLIELAPKNWLSTLFKGEWSLLKGEMKHHLVLTPETDPKLMNQFLYLYRPENR